MGTDGFGRSDTRNALRRFFEVDRHHVVVSALHELALVGSVPRSAVAAAVKRYEIDADSPAPWNR
jgi:pyruvate dehydrogenase E1 component